MHVHPYCESVELRDLSTQSTLFKLRVHRNGASPNPTAVEHFNDVKGLPMFKDHRYELVSVYNNDSEKTQDAMVNMFLFLHDKTFTTDALL